MRIGLFLFGVFTCRHGEELADIVAVPVVGVVFLPSEQQQIDVHHDLVGCPQRWHVAAVAFHLLQERRQLVGSLECHAIGEAVAEGLCHHAYGICRYDRRECHRSQLFLQELLGLGHRQAGVGVAAQGEYEFPASLVHGCV